MNCPVSRKALFCSITLTLFAAGPVHGGQEQGAVLNFLEENDLVVKTDRHYTQGIRFSYLHEDGFLPFGSAGLYECLPQVGFTPEVGKFGYAVGQNIYTPADTDLAQPVPTDRPYSGWLYVGAILQRRGAGFWGLPNQEDFALELGLIGPWSLAKEAQFWIHQIRGFDSPQGWHSQLRNEPGLRLKYQRTARVQLFGLGGCSADFLPHAGFSLGNVETNFRLGGMFRIGYNLPGDYGIQTIDSLATAGSARNADGAQRSHWRLYGFAGSEGKLVAYSTFLDGNLFHDGPSVEKEPLVGDFKAGFAVAYRSLEVGFTQVFRTQEFVGQSEQDGFGSLFLRWSF